MNPLWSAEIDSQDLINRVHPEKDMGNSRASRLGSYGIEVLRLLGIAAAGCALLVALLEFVP